MDEWENFEGLAQASTSAVDAMQGDDLDRALEYAYREIKRLRPVLTENIELKKEIKQSAKLLLSAADRIEIIQAQYTAALTENARLKEIEKEKGRVWYELLRLQEWIRENSPVEFIGLKEKKWEIYWGYGNHLPKSTGMTITSAVEECRCAYLKGE
jgi:hypothetical protein